MEWNLNPITIRCEEMSNKGTLRESIDYIYFTRILKYGIKYTRVPDYCSMIVIDGVRQTSCANHIRKFKTVKAANEYLSKNQHKFNDKWGWKVVREPILRSKKTDFAIELQKTLDNKLSKSVSEVFYVDFDFTEGLSGDDHKGLALRTKSNDLNYTLFVDIDNLDIELKDVMSDIKSYGCGLSDEELKRLQNLWNL